MTDDLIAWLRAQLDDDERMARAARRADGGERGEWERGDGSPTGGTDVWDLNSRSDRPDRGFYRLAGGLDPEVVDHIARHDPARVLAEVDAKRRIVDECEYEIRDSERRDTGDGLGLSETMLSLLALPFADRPGYRDEWRL